MLGVYIDNWDHTSAVSADRTRSIYKASIQQRLLPYVYAKLLYQYEDYHSSGTTGYDEHLGMLTITHLF